MLNIGKSIDSRIKQSLARPAKVLEEYTRSRQRSTEILRGNVQDFQAVLDAHRELLRVSESIKDELLALLGHSEEDDSTAIDVVERLKDIQTLIQNPKVFLIDEEELADVLNEIPLEKWLATLKLITPARRQEMADTIVGA